MVCFTAMKTAGWLTRSRLMVLAAWLGCLHATVAFASEWIPLFDGQSLAGWQTLDGSPIGAGWEVVDGVLHLKQGAEPGGNLVTQREFGDFEMIFEWRVASRGNNGIKYRVRDYDGRTLGLEYQMIDDQDYEGLRPEQTTAAIYDLYAPDAGKPLARVDRFHFSRIVVRANHVQHWLDGVLVTDAQIGSAEWLARVSASKFHDAAAFGQNTQGRIMLTDHHSEVWIRMLYLRELPAAVPATHGCELCQTRMSVTTRPWTSVRRKSRPWKR